MAETARENQVSSAAVKYETVADMGSGLVIAKVKLTDFREQDINARIMKTEMQKQLTDNIKKRGQLESLPFCALIDGRIEIISGHHRIRSAKDSGVLTELFVILDTTGLRRSQVAAKQLAHNAISGFDDQSTLKEIVKNTGAAIHAMIKATESLFDDLHFDESQEWVQLPNLFGSPAIPKEAADTITQALDKMVKEGEIGPKNKWQALEYWAADYLAGK